MDKPKLPNSVDFASVAIRDLIWFANQADCFKRQSTSAWKKDFKDYLTRRKEREPND